MSGFVLAEEELPFLVEMEPFSQPANLTAPDGHTTLWPLTADNHFENLSWWGVGNNAQGIVNDVILVQGNPAETWRTGIDFVLEDWGLIAGDVMQIAVTAPADGVVTGIEVAHNIGQQWPGPENFQTVSGGNAVQLQPGQTHIFMLPVGTIFAPTGNMRIRLASGSQAGRDFYVTGILASRPPEIIVTPPPEPPEPPNFSHTAGFFSAPFNLTLTAEEDTVIRFTTDGSIPTRNSPEFTAPIHIYSPEPTLQNNPMSATAITHLPWGGSNHNTHFMPNFYYNAMVIRARAFANDPDCHGSKTITHSFFVDHHAPDGIRRFGDVQVVSVAVEPDLFANPVHGLYRAWFRPYPMTESPRQIVNVEMFYPGGEFMFSQAANAWVSGQSSRERPKKSLRFNFNQGSDSDVRNMPGLIPNTMRHFYDPTTPIDRFRHFGARQSDPYSSTIRDSLANLISEPLRPTIQNATYGAVFVNGEFWGMSCLRTHRNPSLFAAHFGLPRGIIEMSTDAPGQHWGNAWEVARLLQQNSFEDFQKYVCLDDLIDYIIIGYHFSNWDWITNNFEFWRTTEVVPGVHGGDGKWRFIVQDFDITMGRMGLEYNTNMLTDFTTFDPQNDWRRQHWAIEFINGLFVQPEFRETFAARYSTYTGTVFHPARQEAILNSMVTERAPYIARDSYRWREHVPSASSWSGEIAVVRNFLNRRADYSIRHISDHLGLSTNQGLIRWETDSSMGFFDIAGAQIRPDLFERFGEHGFSTDLFSARYIMNMPIIVTAVPFPGYVFTGFDVCPSSGATYEVLPVNQIIITPTSLAPSHVTANFAPTQEITPYVMINHLYVGGNTGANAVSHSFVELFNPTDSRIYLGNYSVQVQSPADLGSNTTVAPSQVNWDVIPLSGYIEPDSSFLIVSTFGGSNLTGHRVIQNWDIATNYNFANRGISVALVNDQNQLPMFITGNDWNKVIDIVGAINSGPPRDRSDNFFEATTRISRSQGTIRDNFKNTHNNAADFKSVRYVELSDTEWRRLRPRYSGDGPRSQEYICTVCVGDCILGDINGDGRVTSLDATWLARHLIDNNIKICAYAADFYGDGNIGVGHVTLLARWLVGHDVILDQR